MTLGILVTGAAGYLGATICKKLLGSGYGVLAIDTDEIALTQLQSLGEDERIRTLSVDVTDTQLLSMELQKCTYFFDRYVGLVNCVAYRDPNREKLHADFEDYDVEVWRKMLDVNLTGVFLSIQAFRKYLCTKGPASIVNLGSIYGALGTDHRIYSETNQQTGKRSNNPCAYSASKAGVAGLTRYLATLWGGEGIRVNCVSPGGIYQAGMDENFIAEYSTRVPLRAMGDADTVAETVHFLVSDRSKYVTGQEWLVDGGLSVW